MSFEQDQVRAVVRQGLSIVCATCDRFWQAYAAGRRDLRCASRTCDAGPMAGGEFSDYSGPMTEFDRWCLLCGGESTHAVTAVGKTRRLGVCDAHLVKLAQLRPLDNLIETAPIQIKSASGALISVERLLFKKKGLLDHIAEAEEYFQEQDEKKTRH